MGTGEPQTQLPFLEKKKKKKAGKQLHSRRQESTTDIMSTLSYTWNVRGTLNGDFIGASGTTASVDGVADVNGTAGEGAPFNHSSWIWGGFGQYPSHWVATKRSDREVDVHGLVTLKVEGGGTYTAHVHEYMKFWEPCVTINRHFWKLEYLEAEYYPTHWYHKEKAVIDPNWNWGPSKEKMTFSWHLFGNLGNKAIEADGYGYGSGYRQHHWGKGGKGWGEHGLPNLNWALAWEGHVGLHFFTRFPKGVTNPFILSLPEGFTIKRHWWGQDGSHWATTHDLRFEGTHFNKKIVLVGDGFKRDCFMWWDGNKEKGTWIVRSWPQYAVAVPKGNDHVWYRAAFQYELNNGSYYSGYWEMDTHFRKPVDKMPAPYVVKFFPETWDSKPHYWHFYEREEIEQSTYDKVE